MCPSACFWRCRGRGRIGQGRGHRRPQAAHIRLELAASYLQSGRTDVALDEARQAVAADPTYAEAWHLRGLVYLAQREWARAQSDLDRAHELKPNDPDILHNLGWLRCEQKDYDAADALFKQALATRATPSA